MIEQMRAFAELQKAMNPGVQSGVGGNTVMIVGMILSAFSTIFAAIAGWVGAQAVRASRATESNMEAIKKTGLETTESVAKIHTEVNSKTAAMIQKMDEQHAVILALTKELATMRERESPTTPGKPTQ